MKSLWLEEPATPGSACVLAATVTLCFSWMPRPLAQAKHSAASAAILVSTIISQPSSGCELYVFFLAAPASSRPLAFLL